MRVHVTNKERVLGEVVHNLVASSSEIQLEDLDLVVNILADLLGGSNHSAQEVLGVIEQETVHFGLAPRESQKLVVIHRFECVDLNEGFSSIIFIVEPVVSGP